ncbi:MAG: hypothetical protein M1546_21525 [Chloroflexi bacterium]|nr:hypothetical protein [Chloroflexota bacterium]
MKVFSRIRGLFRRPKLPDRPPVSLVLLMLKPRFLDAAMLARLASKTLGVEISATDVEKRAAFVSGKAPCFVLSALGRMFLINNFPLPYFEQPDEVMANIHESRLREAVRNHRAWLSVDAFGKVDERELDDVYRALGKLAAALAMSDCLALYAPATGGLCVYEPGLIDTLTGPNPLDVFKEEAHEDP